MALRQYEQVLLRELGYALDFTRDGGSGAPIEPDAQYWFDPHTGFVRAPAATRSTYPGSTLLRIAAADYETRAARVTAKRVSRRAIGNLLGARPLASRKLVLRLPG